MCELLGDAWVLWVDAFVSWGCICLFKKKAGVPRGHFRMPQGIGFVVQEEDLFLKEDVYVLLGNASFLQRDVLMESVMLGYTSEMLLFHMDMLMCPMEMLGYTKEMPGLPKKISVLPGRCIQWLIIGDVGVILGRMVGLSKDLLGYPRKIPGAPGRFLCNLQRA